MNNLYFIENDHNELIKLKVLEILKEKKLTEENLVTYDMEETDISKAIMDLDTYGFFNETKVVFCKNCVFLTASKSEIEHDIEALTKYLNNPNPANILILSCSKLDGKKNIVKLLKNKAELLNIAIDLKDYVKEKCKGYKINIMTINYLIDSVESDFERLDNELDKLMALKNAEKEITDKDINLITIKKIDNNIFSLIDAIISKDKKKSLKIYEEMTNYGEDVFKIFVALANQIRLIYQVKMLKSLSNDEISSMLNLKNPKQAVALRYRIDKYKSSELLEYLHKLSIMDEELKLGKSIDKIVFPTFIASL